ncbi:S-methyl-5-thioribose kinase [Tropicimonas sp. IMCC34011]|uniref:S-methyl-5-thioribose kinase n=1 Tax=Tropicimonas sp. IMCC34011 TaxID=2248759 RepID=UPI000E23D7A0|nr:S-methyl-5-thioribose kinase [Tropicimonas sp. IMCC34011]
MSGMTKSYPVPPGYAELDAAALPRLLADLPGVPERLGGGPDSWSAGEISDGNMNAVFRVRGPAGSVVVKQALPYIRAIGESWPFPVSRATFEHRAMIEHARHAPGQLPELIGWREDLALLVMEDLSEHVVLRHALVAGRRFPRLAQDLGRYLARTLVLTSDHVMTTSQKARLVEAFAGNSVLSETTQDVVFTGPYWTAPLNRLTPGQETLAAEFRSDGALKAAATEMKHIFRSRAEALVHGDLHTGSVMVRPGDTRVIDPEWAFMGPMAFDIGALIGNLLLAHASQPGHAGDRTDHAEWILETVAGLWTVFAGEFRTLARPDADGTLIPEVAGDGASDAFIDARLRDIFAETLGFAGAKMIRRILGISHVEDFEMIADVPTRAACEAVALRTARRLLLERRSLSSMAEVAALARGMSAGG